MNEIELLKSKITDLTNQLTSTKKAVDSLTSTLSVHKHSGSDGTQKLSSANQTEASQMTIYGGSFIDTPQPQVVLAPFTITASSSNTPITSRREVGQTIVAEYVDTASELLQGVTSVGVSTPNKIESLDKFDFKRTNFAQTSILHRPSDTTNPPSAFFVGLRSPTAGGTGKIAKSGTTLTDTSLGLADSSAPGLLSLVGCYIILLNGATFETHTIASHTKTVITLQTGETWAAESGEYTYFVYAPMYLGSADTPWKRLYTASDIRFGLGPSDASTVMWMKSGSGTPESTVTATPGSIYLDNTGKLFVKSSGTSSTGWTQLGAGGEILVTHGTFTTSTTISSLNGDVDKNYRLVIAMKHSSTAVVSNIYFNGDTGNSYYTASNLTGTYGDSVATVNAGYIDICKARTANYIYSEILINAQSGYYRMVKGNSSVARDTSDYNNVQFSGFWSNTGNNMVSLTIYTSATLEAGEYWLYKTA